MNNIEIESKVITKLLQDTKNKKIIWQKHPSLILENEYNIVNIADRISLILEGVYTASFKKRIFQIYARDKNKDKNIILELSREDSNIIDIRFQPSSALIDLYDAVRNQESGLISFLDDFLMS
ncbi:hypothetical protein [Butyricimonas virosa]|uniref:hypothetical protein n=1 Tax=Butyricimonas virosa TaxID=544645 RepID=UPI0026DBDDD0|nr:hypothetical protein [Butyricimonas virosa]